MMQSEINKAISQLEKGNVILCPTDTIWGISCDALNFDAVEKIYKIKKRDKSKSLVVLVSSFEMLGNFIETIPENIEQVLVNQKSPTTIVYSKAKNLPANVYAKDGSIAIRIVNNGFINKLISSYKKPIVSTSANFSGEKNAILFSEINKNLKQKIDFIVNEKFGSDKTKSSRIILYEKGRFKVLRK